MNFKLKFTAIFSAILFLNFNVFSQQIKMVNTDSIPRFWYLLDLEIDGYPGISLKKAYELMKGKQSTSLIVAVIDVGVDTLHRDLKNILWINSGEIPGNGIDDDHNGYIDDNHGWNFLGNQNGRNVTKDTNESERIYDRLKKKFVSSEMGDKLILADPDYRLWMEVSKSAEARSSAIKRLLPGLKSSLNNMSVANELLKQEIKKDTITGFDVEKYSPSNNLLKYAKIGVVNKMRASGQLGFRTDKYIAGLNEYITSLEKEISIENHVINYRGEVVCDNYQDINDRFYGNNNIMAENPFHGTHVSGIIGGTSNDKIGVKGIANNIRIMNIRAVPDGDEHDKDVALAIRYAVNNGARIINMSFGKRLSPEKIWVDDAIEYAESKGVLIINAAGNDHTDIDEEPNYPNKIRKNGKFASNMLTVAASKIPDENGDYIYDNTNYGQKNVDVFAPGMDIYSSAPGNTYVKATGTSMAAPIVTGIAALILEYYPNLTPLQLKDIILKSSVKPMELVKSPGPYNIGKVRLSELCLSGGIVNAYEAMRLAESYRQ
ncbi:MAG: S8 family serine peptidase [Bacteroidota bacterium]